MHKLSIDELKSKISTLEESAEGQLRGGFAIIGGDMASPLADVNMDCKNKSCNLGCGSTNSGACINNGCNGGCEPTTIKEDEGGSRFIGGGIAF